MIAVGICVSDPELRQRLARVMHKAAGLRVAAAVADADALARVLAQTSVDVVLADLTVGGIGEDQGAALVRFIDEAAEDHALDALHAGAVGVLPRSADDAEIIAAVTAAARGLGVLPQRSLRALLELAAADAGDSDAGGAHSSPLTRRELEVLAALADGASNKAIARRLGISFHTVKFHVAGILVKLGADTRTEAVAQAARRGLVML